MGNLESTSQELIKVLGHVPRYITKTSYDPVQSVARWASSNLPDELVVPTLDYVSKVCGANTWALDAARSHLRNYARTWGFISGKPDQVLPSLIGTSGRSMGIMRKEVINPPIVSTWLDFQRSAVSAAQKHLLKNHIVALDDCLHTGHTVIKELTTWKDSVRPSPGFTVQIVSLSAHTEGIHAVRVWAEEQGGSLLQIEKEGRVYIPGVGRLIPRFTVRDAKRFPWAMIPGSDFEKAAIQYPEIAEYLRERRQVGRSPENFTEEQAQMAQPHSEDLLGAVGILLMGVRAYRRGLSNWSATTGIRPMGYVQEWDPLKRHHELGFGSPFTSWFGAPNTSPLGIWTGPPLVNPPSLFVRKRMDDATLTTMQQASVSDIDDLPF